MKKGTMKKRTMNKGSANAETTTVPSTAAASTDTRTDRHGESSRRAASDRLSRTITVAALSLGLSLPLSTPISHATQGHDEEKGTDSALVQRLVRDFAELEGGQAAAATGGRVDIEPGLLDSRIRLAACQQAEAFLPPNARLWGRTRVGVRCKEGARWTVFVPIDVRIFIQAAVVARPVQAGQMITAEDIRITEVDITREAQTISADGRELIGRVATRNLLPGSTLQAGFSRPRVVMQQGDLVKLVYLGRGFTVEGEGRAVGAASEGEPVRVQVESGRVIAGTARDGRRVEIR